MFLHAHEVLVLHGQIHTHVLEVVILFLAAPLLALVRRGAVHPAVELGAQAGRIGLVVAIELALLRIQVHL